MIQVRQLTKYYGERAAIRDLTFDIGRGEVIGFLGLNGAGKTTTLKVLGCVLLPTSGRVVVDGLDVTERPHEVRKRIGFLPDTPPLYNEMTVGGYLTFAARLRGVTAREAAARVAEAEDKTGLREVHGEVISSLSHGYRQRVGLAQAMVHKPALLILDEPTAGLDPVQIVEMRNLIHDLKENHTVLISSHILTEISQTCDRLLVLGKGQMLAVGTEAELSGRKDDIQQVTVLVRPPAKAGDPYRGDVKPGDGADDDKDKEKAAKPADDPTATIKKLLGGVAGVESVVELYSNADGLAFSLATSKDCRADVSRAIIEAKFDLLKLDFARSELESTFIRLVGGGHASN